MRGCCILALLLVTLLIPDTEGWLVKRGFWRRARGWWTGVIRRKSHTHKGRDIGAASVDANKDGTIDHSELMAFTGEERATRDLLSRADKDDLEESRFVGEVTLTHAFLKGNINLDLEVSRFVGEVTLTHAFLKGDSHVTVDEFERSMRDLMRMDSDELLEDDDYFNE